MPAAEAMAVGWLGDPRFVSVAIGIKKIKKDQKENKKGSKRKNGSNKNKTLLKGYPTATTTPTTPILYYTILYCTINFYIL